MQEEAYPVSGQIEGAVVMPWGQLYGGARRFWWGGPRTGVDRGVVEHVIHLYRDILAPLMITIDIW